MGGLTRSVAISLYKLMAYKDEYEVARLYSDGLFERQLAGELGAPERLTFLLAPPGLSLGKSARGMPRKRRFGT